jgi:hypothetical protein
MVGPQTFQIDLSTRLTIAKSMINHSYWSYKGNLGIDVFIANLRHSIKLDNYVNNCK